jgi:hypothetical protein
MYYPNCADILVKNTKILDNIVHQLLNDSSDAREAAALAIVNIQSRLVDLGIIEKLVKVVQSENEGELQKTNASTTTHSCLCSFFLVRCPNALTFCFVTILMGLIKSPNLVTVESLYHCPQG